jgi:hypothetical protein
MRGRVTYHHLGYYAMHVWEVRERRFELARQGVRLAKTTYFRANLRDFGRCDRSRGKSA